MTDSIDRTIITACMVVVVVVQAVVKANRPTATKFVTATQFYPPDPPTVKISKI